MYAIHNRTAPSYMCNVSLISHSYETRKSKLAYVIPDVKTQGKKSFKYNAISLWNNCPLYLKTSPSKDSFRNNTKIYLQDRKKEKEENDFVYM